MSFTYHPYIFELKKWFGWYDMNDDVDREQFHYDYFRHYDLTRPLLYDVFNEDTEP